MPGKRNARYGGLTTRDLAVRGTVLAVIITVPSLAAFFAAWVILDDLIPAAVAGGITHFAAMGFSLKVSRRLLTKNTGGGGGGTPAGNPDAGS